MALAEQRLHPLYRGLSQLHSLTFLFVHSAPEIVAASHYLLPHISHFAFLATQHSCLSSLKQILSIEKPRVVTILLIRPIVFIVPRIMFQNRRHLIIVE